MGKWTARIGWLLAAVAPPLVAFWQHLAIGHPVITGALVIAYEGILATVRNVGGKLVGRWQDRLVDRVDKALGRRFSSFDRRYREFVAGALRFIDIKGLATVGFYTPELDEVFVEVSVAPSPPIDISPSVLADEPSGGFNRGMLSDFLDGPRPAVIAIVGGPGVGKTTLLLHTAREACAKAKGRRRTVPILLLLRDHVGTILADRDIALPDVLRGTLGPRRAEEPAGWFEQRLEGGDCVVLLDGLDEVAGQTDRRALADWVERQIKQYPKNDFVITSRPHGYLTARVDGATVLRVLRLTDEQVSRFVRGWYQAFESAVERYNRPSGDDSSARRAESAAAALLNRLTKAPELYGLMANPLLLTMVVNVHRFRGQLPASRADLYGEICQVMLGLRQEAKNLAVDFSADKKEMVLRGIAFAMMCQRVRDFRRADVVTTVEPMLSRLPDAVTVAEFLADMSTSGLLVERENGLYAFAHQTFQEYLAAAHIREKGLTRILTGAVDDVWWRETTLLFAARSDADPIVRACLDSDSVTALSLAFDCDAQSSEIAPELRARLKQLLNSAVDPDTDPVRRRLMAGVMVARHLRRRGLASDASQVCTRPITTNLYRLFLRETQSQPPDEPWLLEPDGDEPILGVYGAESAAFAQWVNTITAGEAVCRLPTRAEIEDPVVLRALNGATTWLHSDGGAPELWSPPGQPHPHEISSDVLAVHIKDDVVRMASTLAHLLLLWAVTELPYSTYDRAFALMSGRPLSDFSATELRQALDLAGDLDGTLDLTHSRELLRELDIEIDRAVNRSRSRARSQSRSSSVDLAQAMARVADPGEAHTWAEARASDIPSGDSARACERTRDVIQALTQQLGHLRDVVRHSAPAHVLALDDAIDDGLNVAHALDAFLLDAGVLDKVLTSAFAARMPLARRGLEYLVSPVLARPFRRALSEFMGSKTMASDFLIEFIWAVIAETGIAGTYRVRPDALAGQAVRASTLLSRRSALWVEEVACRFEAVALPVFTWQRPLTPEDATAIRMGALCLAAAAGQEGEVEAGELYRGIAAGVTLLERRTDGRAPLAETIMLTIT
ncbi:MAG TPA: NACHT domain-containing protein [Pseudonocardiaceae bacterium]|jgi:hypothetical protein|nr:NACHT domain-containing protein [Pseudonocardiaceae bacterium]